MEGGNEHDDRRDGDGRQQKRVVDVTKLGASERQLFIQKLMKHVEDDNLRLLQKIRERLERVNVKQPTIQVRYKNLCVEAACEVDHGKPLPTLWNAAKSMFSVLTRLPGLNRQEANARILKDVSGIIKPCRMTLLLGHPRVGKTTLLRALAGRLDKSLKVTGEISYNGYKLDEFVPEKMSAYVSQYNLHIAEMTVRETLDFSARFQGVGGKAEILKEVIRREEEAGITPDPDIDMYMKATSLEGLEASLQTDYVMKIMGLDRCADTKVGNAMKRGISGGEKRRLTTGEIIVGPSRALFMDEISTGLDSSTTCQVVSFLQQLAHISEYTIVISLLQPAPEAYELFDDIILMAEGEIVYHGPRSHILDFFQECGFKCPQRKGTAEFLLEVLSKNDQEQYWDRLHECYNYVTVNQFCEKFKAYHIGQSLASELSTPYDKSNDIISFSAYSLSKWELFKSCFAREFLLMKRNLFAYVFKTTQLAVLAIITGTIFLRTDTRVDILHANYFMGSLFYAIVLQMVNGFNELPVTAARLPVFYKQRDLHFYPAWAYAIPPPLLRIFLSVIDSTIWTSITYYLIGYSPEANRFFCQLLLLILLNLMSSSLFRFVASYFQTMVVSALSGATIFLLCLLLGGFLIPQPSMTKWLRWASWVSPLTYAEIGLAVNEFLAPRWQKILPSNTTVGKIALKSRGLDYNSYYYWISAGALLGFVILFNIGISVVLTYKKPQGASRTIISHEKVSLLQGKNPEGKIAYTNISTLSTNTTDDNKNRKMPLPFIPLAISFQDVNYHVDAPLGRTKKRLQLLHNVTGTFRPGILSALMGVTGAGKTTLLDVLSGRKTGGIIEGEIRIGGFPKVQETFARISAYCEQTDIHSPLITVEESVAYSAWLRLPPEIDAKTRNEFVNEVLETIELNGIRDALVGIAGTNGLSTDQRKRLTVAVELVSNPSIIFMDEPTSGLDARAAAVVMRAVKNVAETGRTIVCTIHQPCIDIFEAFDELMLMKRGGELLYFGPLGHHSSKIVEYFERISGVPRIKVNYNPATWMMEVTSRSVEIQLGINFAQIYKESPLYKDNMTLIKQLNTAPPGSKDLSFATHFAQNGWGQFKAALWKQHLSYWRSPTYNLIRMIHMLLTSVSFGVLYWKHGNNINSQQDLFTILGCIYGATLFSGINSCKSVVPYVFTERAVVCREKFAGMYSPWPYSFAQVAIEIPYVLVEVALFIFIMYTAVGFSWTAYKLFWFSYALFCTLLYFLYFGMMLASATPNIHMATIMSSVFFTLQHLFSGYIVPMPRIPKWWIWFYYISPMSWTLNSLFTSQFGDVKKEIMVFGERKEIASFLEDYFGFYHDRLPLAAIVLLVYPLIFASLFAYFIGKLNYQRRKSKKCSVVDAKQKH